MNVKLVVIPLDEGVMQATSRRFEEERGVSLVEVRVEAAGFMAVRRLLRMAGMDVDVRLDRGVREGHALMVAIA